MNVPILDKDNGNFRNERGEIATIYARCRLGGTGENFLRKAWKLPIEHEQYQDRLPPNSLERKRVKAVSRLYKSPPTARYNGYRLSESGDWNKAAYQCITEHMTMTYHFKREIGELGFLDTNTS